jgi:hypothetical protein
MDDRHSLTTWDREDRLLATVSKPILRPKQLTIQYVPGTSSTGINRLEREVDSYQH